MDNSNDLFEKIFLVCYTIEMFFKIFAQGFVLNEKSYLRNYWNMLDFLIVISMILSAFFDSSINLGGFRALRILRPLRTISSIKNLRIILVTLFSALPLLKDTLVILIFFFIIFAIAGENLFSGQLKKRCFSLKIGIKHQNDLICGEVICPIDYSCVKLLENPNWGYTNFDNFIFSFFQIFQCITLEGWSEISSLISKSFSSFAIVYFISSVILGSYFILGITLAVIKAQFSETHEKFMKLEKKKTIL